MVDLSHAKRVRGLRELNKLNEKHQMVLRLELMGKSNKQIASVTGYEPTTVAQIKTRDDYQLAKAAMRAELNERFLEKASEDFVKDPVRRRLEEAKVKAIEINIDLMKNAESENVRQRSVFDILDRAGYKPKDKVEHSGGVNLGADTSIREDIRAALSDLQKDEEKGDE